MDLNLLKEEELASLRQLLTTAKNIVICAHRAPDGDAMGSSLAWMDYLNGTGKTNVKVCMPDAKEADLVCCLDFNQPSRVDAMQEALESSEAPRLLIDHHLDPDEGCALAISRPDMSSTSEIVFRLIYQLGGFETMTRQCAECIYCGMMTDTGGFTYNSSRPEIYYIIGQLLTKRIDKDEIYNRVFHNYSTNALRLRSHIILNKMKVVEELHAAYFTVTKEDMRQFHFIKGDMEGLVNVPQQIKGLKLSISLREDTEKQNTVLVSLRSCNGFHCQPMATKFFNGGGHADAAGGKLNCTLEEAEQVVIKALLYYKDQLQTKVL